MNLPMLALIPALPLALVLAVCLLPSVWLVVDAGGVSALRLPATNFGRRTALWRRASL